MTSRRAPASETFQSGPLVYHPGKLHLRQSGDLGDSTQGKREGVGVRDKTRNRPTVDGIVEKNLIHDESSVVVAAKIIEGGPFRRRHVRPGWIIWMNENYSPGPRRRGFV